MNDWELKHEINELISLKQEGEYWDFKKEWYSNKPDLLHDIICMANNPTYHDGFIVIGVDEENDFSICDIADDLNRRRTQDIVSFLFVVCNYEKYDLNKFSDRLPHFPEVEGYVMDEFKKQYLNSLLLQQMLIDFRE